MIFKFSRIILSIISIFFCDQAFSQDFSERKNVNKILKGFYKNSTYECNYINKSWSTGFNDQPYGMVNNNGAFSSIVVFKHQNFIGTLWPKIGEISTERGVRKYQLWKKTKNDKFELIPTDYLDDKTSADLNLKDIQTFSEYKTYFDNRSLKIASKSWITDFYSCEKVDHSNFAREKLIDIFVNQNIYVEKDFKYREKNPTSFSNKIDLIKE
tara:strand:- start:354 stop:989 length:636 start_codon:yes stop_codon:yes gene_type:complete